MSTMLYKSTDWKEKTNKKAFRYNANRLLAGSQCFVVNNFEPVGRARGGGVGDGPCPS